MRHTFKAPFHELQSDNEDMKIMDSANNYLCHISGENSGYLLHLLNRPEPQPQQLSRRDMFAMEVMKIPGMNMYEIAKWTDIIMAELDKEKEK